MRDALRLIGAARGERLRLALAIALSAGAAGSAIALLATSGYLISRAAQRPEILALMVAIVAVRAFGLSRALLRYGERLASHDLALRQLARLRERVFAALVPRVPGALRERSGQLLSRFVADVEELKDLHPRVLIPGALAICVVLGASIAGWAILPAAGLVLLSALTLLGVAVATLGAGLAGRSARRQAGARAELTAALVEAIDGSAELALAGRAREWVGRLREADGRLARLARGDALGGAIAQFAGQALAAATLLALLLVALPAVHSRLLSGVLLAALVFLALGAMENVLPLAAAGRSLRVCQTAASRIAVLAPPPGAEVAPRAQERWRGKPRLVEGCAGARDSSGKPRPVEGCAGPRDSSHPGAGSLRMREVSFRYDPSEAWVLKDAQLEVRAGARLALTGASGAGKSTVGELLAGLREPCSGSICVGGRDARAPAELELRRTVLLCGQDCHVFNTSVRENLLLARRSAGEQELWRALATVELEQWARALADGLDTIVGQAGERLSGGQRTRLALARALLSDAPFVILDEPTAHLDAPLAAPDASSGAAAGRARPARDHSRSRRAR